jgi:FixJ family two-component response regulator
MSAARQTVCVIDDDASVLRALGRLLRSVGFHAATFPTAEAFLECAEAAAARCLVVDVHLPGLGGLDLQERLRAEGRDVPVVFITAFGDERARARALRAGALAFLEKPFGEQALLDAVQQAVRPGS